MDTRMLLGRAMGKWIRPCDGDAKATSDHAGAECELHGASDAQLRFRGLCGRAAKKGEWQRDLEVGERESVVAAGRVGGWEEQLYTGG
jgi:hypothetical protein